MQSYTLWLPGTLSCFRKHATFLCVELGFSAASAYPCSCIAAKYALYFITFTVWPSWVVVYGWIAVTFLIILKLQAKLKKWNSFLLQRKWKIYPSTQIVYKLWRTELPSMHECSSLKCVSSITVRSIWQLRFKPCWVLKMALSNGAYTTCTSSKS